MMRIRRGTIWASLLILLIALAMPIASASETAAPGGMNYVLADGYIYYSVETESGGALYRMRSDGTDAEQIAPNAAIWLSVASDRIYYVNLEFAEMYSMNLDGSDISHILSQPCSWVAAAGESVYARLEGEAGSELVKLSKDAADPTTGMADMPVRVTDEPIDGSILIRDGWIYYSSMKTDGPDGEVYRQCLYKMRTDGSSRAELLNTERNCVADLLDIRDGRLYYALFDENPQLCSMDLDDGNVRVIADVFVSTCSEGWAYYQQEIEIIDEPPEELEKELGLDLEPNRYIENALCRISLDGSEAQQITLGPKYSMLSAAGDWLFFLDDQQPGVPSMMCTDGSDRRVVPGYSEYISPEQQAYDSRGEALEFGEGSVCVYVTSGARMAAYKLLRVEHDGSLTEARSCLLEPNQHAYLYVSPGNYVLKTAEGDTWISDDQAFGSSGHYTTTEPTELIGGYRYSIGSGPQGDFYGDTSAGFANP